MNWIVVAESRVWYELNLPSEYQVLLCYIYKKREREREKKRKEKKRKEKKRTEQSSIFVSFVVKMKSSRYSSSVLHLSSTEELQVLFSVP